MDDRQLLALVVVVQFDSLSLWERVGVRPERKLQPQRCCGLQPAIRSGILRSVNGVEELTGARLDNGLKAR